jgi:ABC-type amino acid transport substrate-binding protein
VKRITAPWAVGRSPGKRVVSVTGTTASDWLREHGIAQNDVSAIDAYDLLRDGDADAILRRARSAVLRAAQGGNSRSARSSSARTAALRCSEAARCANVNLTLLELRADGTYQRLYNQWFGAPERADGRAWTRPPVARHTITADYAHGR